MPYVDDTDDMLQVLCSESEPAEYGEVIMIGERVSRLAARIEQASLGTDLDAVQWRFDRYAEAVDSEAARITGTVSAISAVWVRLALSVDGVWTSIRGSARLEDVPATDSGFAPDVGSHPTPAALLHDGRVVVSAGPDPAATKDERLSGSLITLNGERIDSA